MRIVLKSSAVILAFVAVFGAAHAQKKPALTNPDIVRMVKAKFADSTIVKAIEANHTAFDVSASALIMLRDSGVSQSVIEAMLSAETPKGANVPPRRAATTGKPAQASSPQSQQSGASAPPSPTESQAQSRLPCPDAPVLNGGQQPALSPCPDPPAASPLWTPPPRSR